MAVAGPSQWTFSEIGTLKERLNLLINWACRRLALDHLHELIPIGERNSCRVKEHNPLDCLMSLLGYITCSNKHKTVLLSIRWGTLLTLTPKDLIAFLAKVLPCSAAKAAVCRATVTAGASLRRDFIGQDGHKRAWFGIKKQGNFDNQARKHHQQPPLLHALGWGQRLKDLANHTPFQKDLVGF